VVFVPDGVDLEATQPSDVTALRAEMGLEGNLVIGLVGTMAWSDRHQMGYGWDVIEALGLLGEAKVRALLIGDGNGRAILERRAEQLEVRDRVVFTGALPYRDLPRYLSAIDVCVSTQSNDLVGMVRTTGKLPLYLACGKYVIATDVGEASRVLPGVGTLLPYEGVRDDRHPARLAECVQGLLENPQHLDVSRKARSVAREHFDYARLAARVHRACESLLSSSH
jgi:glycosyltransferase involved in cell wall biosynthesis